MENIDHRISHAIADFTKRSKFLSKLAVLGAVEIIWFMAGVLVVVTMIQSGSPQWFYEWDGAVLLLSGGIVVPWAVTMLVEYLVKRSRPFQREGRKALIDMAIVTPSFPSGHATLTFAMCATIAKLQPEMLPAFLLMALFVVVSRVAVGVHFVSDIVVGAIVGWFVGGFAFLLPILILSKFYVL